MTYFQYRNLDVRRVVCSTLKLTGLRNGSLSGLGISVNINIVYRSSRPEVFCKKRSSYKFRKIHRKTPVPEISKKFLGTSFLTEDLWWLLLGVALLSAPQVKTQDSAEHLVARIHSANIKGSRLAMLNVY